MDDAHLGRSLAMVLNEAEIGGVRAQPLYDLHFEFIFSVGCFGDQGEGAVGSGLRVMHVSRGTPTILGDIVRSKNVKGEMLFPVFHDLQCVPGEGCDSSQ